MVVTALQSVESVRKKGLRLWVLYSDFLGSEFYLGMVFSLSKLQFFICEKEVIILKCED